jgi:hypothetical protein
MTQESAGLRSVNLTEARNLSPLFDEAVRHEQPVLIVRNRREWGVLVSRDAMLRMLESYRFHAHVVPEDDGSFTLWLDELELGAHRPTLYEARQELLATIRSYLSDYRAQFDFYRHLPDRASQEPYVVRLSLARDDAELLDMLFPAAAEDAELLRATAS